MKKTFLTLCFLFIAAICHAEGNVTDDWRNAGFNDYDASGWMANGIGTADAAKAWQDAGFAPGAAKTWSAKKFDPAAAKAWKAAGMNSVNRAAKLEKAGLTPESYQAANPSGTLQDEEVIDKAGKGK